MTAATVPVEGLAWMEQQEAFDLLRVSNDNLLVVNALCSSVPQYIEVTTGYPAALVEDEPSELVKQLARFVLQLWYNPDGTDALALKRVVDSLSCSVRAMVVAGMVEE